MLFPQGFVLIFNNDPQMIDFASHALRLFMAVALFSGIRFSFQIVFISLGNAKSSLILVILRKVVLMIPLIIILPIIFNGSTDAIFIAQPIADIITVIVAAFIFRHTFRKTLNRIEP
jgi:Na+-driven multidrug efflux pump